MAICTRNILVSNYFNSCLMTCNITHHDVIMGAIASQIASRLFTQPFIQTQIKENTKAPRHWLCAGNSLETGEFPAQMAHNAEKVSIWWRYHDSNKQSHWTTVNRHHIKRRKHHKAICEAYLHSFSILMQLWWEPGPVVVHHPLHKFQKKNLWNIQS